MPWPAEHFDDRGHLERCLHDAQRQILGKVLTPLMNTTTMRKRNIPDHIGRDLMLHCAEEMHHLAVILPELYRRFGPV